MGSRVVVLAERRGSVGVGLGGGGLYFRIPVRFFLLL